MPWAPVQSARKGMATSHLPSKLMESIQLTLALPSGRGAADFSTNAVKVPVRKEKRLMHHEGCRNSIEVVVVWEELMFFPIFFFECLKISWNWKAFFVVVTLWIQSLAHRKKMDIFCGVPIQSPSTLCWGSLSSYLGMRWTKESVLLCNFLTHLDKPERVIPYTCCQPPSGWLWGLEQGDLRCA